MNSEVDAIVEALQQQLQQQVLSMQLQVYRWMFGQERIYGEPNAWYLRRMVQTLTFGTYRMPRWQALYLRLRWALRGIWPWRP